MGRFDRRQKRVLVLPSYGASEIDAPDLVAPFLVSERFERNDDLDDPALVVHRGLDVPDRVPIIIIRHPLVADALVAKRPERIGLEEEPVAAVVERIEHDSEVLVLENIPMVAAHLVYDHPLGMAVPATRGDVDVLIVEKHPRFRFFGCRRPLVRLLLDEVADGRNARIGRVVELPIENDRFRDPGCAQRHPAPRVSGNDLGRYWGRRPMEKDRGLVIVIIQSECR